MGPSPGDHRPRPPRRRQDPSVTHDSSKVMKITACPQRCPHPIPASPVRGRLLLAGARKASPHWAEPRPGRGARTPEDRVF